jgi:LemA protein
MTFSVVILAAAILLVISALWAIGTYNGLVRLRQNVRESWSAIETELRRRYDLIPNLVETVKGYASHERGTLEAVIQARNSVVTNAPIENQIQSQNVLTGALNKLMALSESYPQLKANDNFNQLSKELADTETRISQARRFYNANVKELNSNCETFPSVFIANAFSIRQQPYYGIEDADAYNPVSVKFADNTNEGTKIKLQDNKISIEDIERK